MWLSTENMVSETKELNVSINLNLKTEEALILYPNDMVKWKHFKYNGLHRLLKLFSTVFF